MKTTIIKAYVLLALGITLFSCSTDEDENSLMPTSNKIQLTFIDKVGNIDSDAVIRVANGFTMKSKTRASEERQIKEILPVCNAKGDTLLYVVNYAEDKGYVLLSATKEYEPVLAYGETGDFPLKDIENMGVSVYLDEYKNALEHVELLPDSIRFKNKQAWNQYFKRKEPLSLVPNKTSRAVNPDLEYQVGIYIEESLEKWRNEGYDVIYPYGDGSILNEIFYDSEIDGINNMLHDYADDRFFGGWAETVFIIGKSVTQEEAVGPLVKSTWGQKSGYGQYAPNGYAGCVAVAMGQIMRYYEYPTSYDWNAMAYNYATDATAKFFREIGTNVDMNYSKSDRSSSNIDKACKALKNKYGYGQSKIVTHYMMEDIRQLRNGRPVYMRGEKGNDGHAWVCDGYKETIITTDYQVMAIDKATFDHQNIPYYRSLYSCSNVVINALLHLNWGWYGYKNGYYSENLTNEEYTEDRKDIIDIYPTK